MSAKDKSFQTIGEVSVNYINYLEEPISTKSIKTGFTDFDYASNGLQLGALTILAARPSMGKTTLALNIAVNIAIEQNIPLAYFSFEMDNKDCVQSIFSSLNDIDKHKLRTLQCSSDELQQLHKSASELSNSPLFFSSSSLMTLQQVCDSIKQLTKDVGLKVVIIDYLQLIHSTTPSYDNHSAWMSEISHTLRLLAVELDISIVVLSQVGRELETRVNKRPILSDLGRWGDIEQDASLVVFIYRDDVYNEDSPEKNIAEIIVSKNNYGPIGTCSMTFNGRFSRFEKFNFSY